MSKETHSNLVYNINGLANGLRNYMYFSLKQKHIVSEMTISHLQKVTVTNLR